MKSLGSDKSFRAEFLKLPIQDLSSPSEFPFGCFCSAHLRDTRHPTDIIAHDYLRNFPSKRCS